MYVQRLMIEALFYVFITLVMGPKKLTLNGFGVKFDPKVASRVLHVTRLFGETI